MIALLWKKHWTIAQTVLADLEKQAAGYTSLTIPSNLNIELEDKREEVARPKGTIRSGTISKERDSAVSSVRDESSISDAIASAR
jgi:hypothetical protein